MNRRVNGLVMQATVIAGVAIAAISVGETAAGQARSGAGCFDRCYNTCLQRIPSNSGGFSNKNCSSRCAKRCAQGGRGRRPR
jgi:hypothetical protein